MVSWESQLWIRQDKNGVEARTGIVDAAFTYAQSRNNPDLKARSAALLSDPTAAFRYDLRDNVSAPGVLVARIEPRVARQKAAAETWFCRRLLSGTAG